MDAGGLLLPAAEIRLRLTGGLLACVHITCFLVPWARVYQPGLLPMLGPSKSNFADIGLVRCLSGSVCEAFNAVYGVKDDDRLPPFLKERLDGQIAQSPVFTANVIAVLCLLVAFLMLALAELMWCNDTAMAVQGMDARVALACGASTATTAAALLYCAVVQSALNGGPFLAGVYLSMGAGVITLTLNIFVASSVAALGPEAWLLPRAARAKRPGGYGAIPAPAGTQGAVPPVALKVEAC